MPGNTWVEQRNLDEIESAINQLQISVNDLSYQVGRILGALNRGETPTALTIGVDNQQILAKDGTLIMSGIATVTSNYNLRPSEFRRLRISLPGLNPGITFAGTCTCAPVFGLRPTRALRTFTTNVPKSRSSTRSRWAIAETIRSSMALTAFFTSWWKRCGF